MIRELVNYSEWLKKDFPDLFEGKLEEGLHVFVKLNNDKISEIKTYKIGKKLPQITDENKFVFDFAKQVFKSNVISVNKCLHNDKYILSLLLSSRKDLLGFYKGVNYEIDCLWIPQVSS